MYFITICIKNRINILGEIKKNKMQLSQEGIIAEKFLGEIPKHYQNVKIDEYVIMPNHIHFILNMQKNNQNRISQIIGQYKRKVSIELKYSIWQKSFYEHIIKNYYEYLKIKKYIIENPKKWNEDLYNQ